MQFNSIIPSTICATKMSGMPITNFICLVLCRNAYIPANVPILPKRILITKMVFSGILLLCFLAFALSIPMTANPITFITMTNNKISICITSMKLLHSKAAHNVYLVTLTGFFLFYHNKTSCTLSIRTAYSLLIFLPIRQIIFSFSFCFSFSLN